MGRNFHEKLKKISSDGVNFSTSVIHSIESVCQGHKILNGWDEPEPHTSVTAFAKVVCMSVCGHIL